MIYDLSNKAHRKQVVNRVNGFLRRKTGLLNITDETPRTLNQNKYLHVLIRILALETGVTEDYAKSMYFKRMANPEIFIKKRFDSLTGEEIEYLESSSYLSTEVMSRAIDKFRIWSEDKGYYLPEAHIGDDGSYEFETEEDRLAFNKGLVETSRVENYL